MLIVEAVEGTCARLGEDSELIPLSPVHGEGLAYIWLLVTQLVIKFYRL